MNQSQLSKLVHQLVAQPQETEWIELKLNRVDPQAIGEYISALFNSAALLGRLRAYILWGVEDVSHKLVGTSFETLRKRLGIKKSSYSLAYRIIRDAIKAQLIKPHGGEVGAGKSASYLPFWA